MPANVTQYPQPRLSAVAAIFAGIGVLSSIADALFASVRGHPLPFLDVLARAMLIWLLFGLLSLLAIWTARRYPLETSSLLRNVPAHFAALVVISATHTFIYTLVVTRIGRWGAPNIGLLLRGEILGNLRGDVFLYGMMIGAYYLYAFAARNREVKGAAADLEIRALQLEAALSDARLARESSRPPEFAQRIAVKDQGRITLVPAAEIDWIEAEGDYARIHTATRARLMRESLTQLERRLDPARFLRVHRSTIVNLEKIAELQPYFHGEYVIITTSGARLKVSRTYGAALERAIG